MTRPSSAEPNTSWQSLIADLTEVQIALYGPDEEDQRETPGFPATDVEIDAVEAELRYRLPAHYREFLKAAGGWRQMYETTHALSPGELLAGELHVRALQVLSEQDDAVLAEHGIQLQDLLPIAVSEFGLDLMSLIIRGPLAGQVLWTIGVESTLFPTMRDLLTHLTAVDRALLDELNALDD